MVFVLKMTKKLKCKLALQLHNFLKCYYVKTVKQDLWLINTGLARFISFIKHKLQVCKKTLNIIHSTDYKLV